MQAFKQHNSHAGGGLFDPQCYIQYFNRIIQESQSEGNAGFLVDLEDMYVELIHIETWH